MRTPLLLYGARRCDTAVAREYTGLDPLRIVRLLLGSMASRHVGRK